METNNQTLIMGRLGAKPEIAYSQKQEPICKFTVAEKIKDSDEPRWHRVVVFGKQAELCSAQLDKGWLVFVQGRNVDQEYTNKKGVTKKYLELRANFVGANL